MNKKNIKQEINKLISEYNVYKYQITDDNDECDVKITFTKKEYENKNQIGFNTNKK